MTPTAENDRDDERLAIREAWSELPLAAEKDALARALPPEGGHDA